MSPLTEETLDDILYFARTNDASELLPLLTTLTAQHTSSTPALLLAAADPDTGNTALHYAAANGHAPLLAALLQHSPTDATARQKLVAHANQAGSTALHYASANGQLDAVRTLVAAHLPVFHVPAPSSKDSDETDKPPPEDKYDGILTDAERDAQIAFLELNNQAGRDAAAEAEAAGKENVVGWLLGALDRLEPAGEGEASAADGEADVGEKELAEDVEGVSLDGQTSS